MAEQTNNKNNFLNKDLKKLIIVSLIIVAGLIVLAIVNSKTNFLFNLTEKIMKD